MSQWSGVLPLVRLLGEVCGYSSFGAHVHEVEWRAVLIDLSDKTFLSTPMCGAWASMKFHLMPNSTTPASVPHLTTAAGFFQFSIGSNEVLYRCQYIVDASRH
jgi:hypothetical protein